MNKKLLQLILIFVITILSFGEDLTDVSFQVLNEDKKPIEEANISIGDLSLKTDEEGVVNIELFPASYDITFSKERFFSQTKTFDISNENNNFKIFLRNRFINIDIQVIDELTQNPLQVSVKKERAGVNSNDYTKSDSNGNITFELEKNNIYNFSIDEKNYKYFTFKLDTSNLNNSSFIFKLKRIRFETSFNFNVNSGNLIFKLKNQKEIFQEVSFSDGSKSLDLPYGEFYVKVSSQDYNSLDQVISINSENKKFEFNLKPNFKTFHFGAILENDQDLLFYKEEENIPKTLVSNSKLKIISSEETIESKNLEDSLVSLDLDFGRYIFEIENPYSKKYSSQEVILDEESPQYIIMQLEKKLATISGVIQNKNNFLGGIQIFFENSNGDVISTTSKIDGSFNLKVPPRDYKISIENSGYRLIKEEDKSIKNINPNEEIKLTLETEEIPSVIKGTVTDLKGEPLKDVEITVRVSKNENKYYTDNEGKYIASVKSGLVMMKLFKKGYHTKGTVKKVDKFSTISGVDFQLQPFLSSIQGTVLHKGTPIKDTTVNLVDGDDDVIISTKTKDSGEFELNNIPVFKEYKIKIQEDKFIDYSSDTILIKKEPIDDFIINLNKNIFSIILEVKDNNEAPISNLEVKYGEQSLNTDASGIISFDIPRDTNLKNIQLRIPSKNITKEISIDNQEDNIIKKEIIIENEQNIKE
ncbi:MAG: hypothetical protein ACQERZ_03045, partial [Fusobacteriota bacterium]